jgi:GNAT superfamily N-acetyltransferase
MVEIGFKLDADKADLDAIGEPLAAFNHRAMGRHSGYRPFAFHLTERPGGEPIGGLAGWSDWDWLFIVMIFVPESLRGQGLGRELMQRAENHARDGNLRGIWLDTFDFQARPFYEKLGYTVFGTLDDHPIGGQRYFMQKRLVDA